MPWSILLNRPMVPEEKLETMGWPTFLLEMTLGVGLPWASVLPSLGPSHVEALAGNAMHVAAISLVVAYCLAYTVRVETDAP